MWHQDSPDIEGGAEQGDQFGYSLAAGDFDGDGYADLAVGVPEEDVGGVSLAGAVNVIYGSADGLSEVGDQMWHQDSPGILGDAEPGDQFGHSLATGDFDGDGYTDLAVDVALEEVGGVSYAGALHVLFGSADGLSAADNQFWHQDSPGIADSAEQGDYFSYSLAACDFNGDGYADLAVGALFEDIDGVGEAGAVNILYGSAGGLSEVGNQFWHQDSPGILDDAEENDYFGFSLACMSGAGTVYRVHLPAVIR